MLVTKEKITFFVAIGVAALAMGLSVSNFTMPDAVPDPAESERAKPVNLGDELVPTIAPKHLLKPDEGRNPFQRSENYSEQAPVPLPLPPSLESPSLIPSAQSHSMTEKSSVRVYVPANEVNEDDVTESGDALPDPNAATPDNGGQGKEEGSDEDGNAETSDPEKKEGE